ncbi:hypothetical protein [Mycoavidus sp. B2-EB]|uniref:hypothetical protein n=1 Tax=Mycoavidus sp. B2-EB TaxID=2651972 RepID=UPI0016261A30|nr:hypothetical protein [Mycoavidus sp. B2-EB]BBO59719.1 hypothetical protein MPB2EB_0844 [Mycoavidus sp. B2-EB]
MSLIVAGRFDTFEKAQQAAQVLFEHGFAEEDVTIFFVNPPGQHDRLVGGTHQVADPSSKSIYKGASIGLMVGATLGASIGAMLCTVFGLPLLVTLIAASVGAYLGSLMGAMAEAKTSKQEPALAKIHESGVLLAIHVTVNNQADATAVLRKASAKDIERAHGRWTHGRWSDFDPSKEPSLPKNF